MAFTFTDNSATISTTEWFLASNSATATAQTTQCVLDVMLDLSAMVAGDSFRIRVYEKVNGGSMKIIYDATPQGVQASPLWTLPRRIALGNGWEVSVIKVSGTDRAIPWSLRLQTPDSIDTSTILARLPSALVGGRMDCSVGAYQSGQAPLQPTVAGRTLDVSTGGEAGVDWANVGSPTTTNNLSGTTVSAVSGAVGSVTGAVGSVTGSVGSVAASGITASSLASNTITAAKIATDAIGAAQLASDAVTEIQSGLGTSANQTTILANIAALPSASTIATAVLAATIHTGWSVARALRIIGGAVAGKFNGSAFRYLDDSGDAVTATSDTDGKRTAATYGA